MYKIKKIFGIFVIFVLAGLFSTAYAQIPTKERDILIKLYETTDGANWEQNTNWLGEPGTECSWYGVTCDAAEEHIIGLYFAYNKLSGNIPPGLGNLSDLKALHLFANQLSGNIPPELGNLSNLESLKLWSNQLSGNIPPELGNLSNLEILQLRSNQLSGNIPPELGNLSNLQALFLELNQLSGNIPPELGNLSNLRSLDLFINQLSGNIPPELGKLSNLEYLELFSNQLTGNIPHKLGNLSNLGVLSLYSNQLSGNIPPELGNLSNLYQLLLSNNQLSGNIPPELGNLSNLRVFDLANNQLSGKIPPELGKFPNLSYLTLANNQLECEIPDTLINLNSLIPCASDYSTDFRYNHLYTSDPDLRDFLNRKQCGGDWESSQTPSCTECIEDNTGSIDIANTMSSSGSIATVPVLIHNAPNAVSALGVDVTFDPDLFTYTGFNTVGTIADRFSFFDVNEISPGTVRIGGFTSSDNIALDENGVLVYLNFKVADPAEKSSFELSNLIDDISTWSDSPGCFNPQCSPDVNNDDEITPGDALDIFDKYMGVCPTTLGTSCDSICGDINGDGDVTPADALIVFYQYLGKPFVYSVTPQTVTLGQETLFIVTGGNLPETTEYMIDGCTDLTDLGGTSEVRSFKCTQDSIGQKNADVKDQPDGTELLDFIITVE